jgi:molybdenum cofactor biosynthesis enzyme MoaA
MKLEEIGFYTLSDQRAANSSVSSRLHRCEMILTARCNFNCPYCRHVGGSDLDFEQAAETIRLWAKDRLYAIRFSGGEPMLYPRLRELVELAKASGIEKIAISTNGSMPFILYNSLVLAGVNDFSISLDACCAEDCDKMSGGIKGKFDIIVNNIRRLSEITYVTVGVVLTDDNVGQINEIIQFAKGLGVSDIRVIPAAQDGDRLTGIKVDQEALDLLPILKYRVTNIQAGRPVRGLTSMDSNRCGLVLDDMAVCKGNHYACIIHMREGGAPIGKVGPEMRKERESWYTTHDTHSDSICSKNCLDVCVDYNNTFRKAHLE